jgi:PKD repeat protein
MAPAWIPVEGGPAVIPIGAAAPITITADNPTVVVVEGDTAANTGTIEFGGETPVLLSASDGTVVANGDGTWSWSSSTNDGPADSRQITVLASAGESHSEVTFDLTVNNVAPTITAVTASSGLVGQPITVTGSATDPSSADTAAGFDWTFDGTATNTNAAQLTFDDCGTHTVTATAADKDGSPSSPVTTSVVVSEARFSAPLDAAHVNLVQSGQVVPVKVAIGCDGVALANLHPSIELLNGDVVVDGPTPMRSVGRDHLFNLRVPGASAGSRFTVRVRPFADSNAVLDAVLQVRK